MCRGEYTSESRLFQERIAAMKTMFAAAVIVLLAGTPALAQWGYGPAVVAPAPMVAYYPPPAYYAPAPVPLVTYYGPAPVYAYPPAVYVCRG